LVEVLVEGRARPRLALAPVDDLATATPLDDLATATPVETAGAVALLPRDDALFAFQGDPSLLVDEEHARRLVPAPGAPDGRPLGAAHLPLRAVVAGGRLVGLWEHDPDAGAVVLGCLEPPPRTLARRLAAAADELTALLRELGHGRASALDTDEELRERARFVRALASVTRRSGRSGRGRSEKARGARR
jgi:hypothetical protein